MTEAAGNIQPSARMLGLVNAARDMQDAYSDTYQLAVNRNTPSIEGVENCMHEVTGPIYSPTGRVQPDGCETTARYLGI